MCAHGKVLNISTNQRIKRSQARNRVEQCLSAWVEDGLSIRDLTLAERVAARSEQARLREPLAVAELPGVKFEPSVSGLEAYRNGRRMVLDATAICAGYYHPSPA